MRNRALIPLLTAVLLSASCEAAQVGPAHRIEVDYQPVEPTVALAQLTHEVVRQLQSKHYNPVTLNNEFSRELLSVYLDHLDGRHRVFLASDIAYFRERFGTGLDEALLEANVTPAYVIYNTYQKRRIQILQWVLDLLSEGIDTLSLKDQESLLLNRENAPWPEDIAARRELWSRQLENQVISMRLSGVDKETIHKRLTRRFSNRLKQLRQSEPMDVIAVYLNAVTGIYDPHTTYFTPRRIEDFQISMQLSLQGIGAQLRSRNGYPVIVRLIPGGPAMESGEIEPTDRIIAVAQGKDGEFVDLGALRLGEAVQLIRGRKGTVVRLHIVSQDGSESKIVSLVRDKIKLSERDASKRIIEIERSGQTYRVGLIRLPSFYQGASRDVRKLLIELKKQDIVGVILDLRNNGGGSLREVTELVGLFMPPSPSVQIRGAEGEVQVLGHSGTDPVYSGPLVVMVNRLSASASEIFAGAIQDYGRGLLVGSRTFGKGTVQALMPVSKGRLKLTRAKFYRVTGASTQLRGVTPDIHFPSSVDPSEIGESSLPHALPWDRIDPVPHPHSDRISEILPELRARHQQRIKTAPKFQYRVNRIQLSRKRSGRERVSVNIEQRRELRAKHRHQILALVNAYRQKIGKEPFEDYQAYKESDAAKPLDESADKASEADAYQVESARILLDMWMLLNKASLVHAFL